MHHALWENTKYFQIYMHSVAWDTCADYLPLCQELLYLQILEDDQNKQPDNKSRKLKLPMEDLCVTGAQECFLEIEHKSW